MVCSTWPEKLLADLNMSLKCICQLIVKIRLNRRHFNSIGYFRNKSQKFAKRKEPAARYCSCISRKLHGGVRFCKVMFRQSNSVLSQSRNGLRWRKILHNLRFSLPTLSFWPFLTVKSAPFFYLQLMISSLTHFTYLKRNTVSPLTTVTGPSLILNKSIRQDVLFFHFLTQLS